MGFIAPHNPQQVKQHMVKNEMIQREVIMAKSSVMVHLNVVEVAAMDLIHTALYLVNNKAPTTIWMMSWNMHMKSAQ